MIAFPEWVVPMAATLTEKRFVGPDWIFERKFDGIRLLAFKQGRGVRLYSRNQLPQTIPPVAAAIAALAVNELILDGEVTWDRQTAFHVFDVLWHDGSVMSRPFDERRALLNTVPLDPPLHRVAEVTGPAPWQQACADGWEGGPRFARGAGACDASNACCVYQAPIRGTKAAAPAGAAGAVAFIEWTAHGKLRHPRLIEVVS